MSYKKILNTLGVLLFSQILYCQVHTNVLTIGPFPTHDVQYFYVDTKIPFTERNAPQIHITAYNYAHENKAIKLTLGWYVYANKFHWTQYRSELGYYTPSQVRLGTYDDAGTTRIRIEIANDMVYWSSWFLSATDSHGVLSDYSGWTYHIGGMPSNTGNIEVASQYRGGNIGIGTNYPDYKLDVTGTIRGHQVLVNTQKGADFVFEDGYDLRSLDEVEQFIVKNKHLPDIPSAQAMIQEGVDMGELQILLLQKVEELTLHIIELEKQVKKLQQK